MGEEEREKRIEKISGFFRITFKVLYIVDFIMFLCFMAFAIAFPIANTIPQLSAGECAIMFGIMALYSFMLLGVFWNGEKFFEKMQENKTPCSMGVVRYLKKIGLAVFAISLLPALVGSVLIHLICPGSDILFRVEIVGVVAGIFILLLAYVFENGASLKEQDSLNKDKDDVEKLKK